MSELSGSGSLSTVTALDTWNELVTVGLLGTDRRDPPELPPGPVDDLVADALRSSPEGRVLATVAALVVARRCGARPLAPEPVLMAAADDPRPMLPVAAARRWHAIASLWPVLEPEWLVTARRQGWRPSPDVLVAMLRRHGRTGHVAAAVVAFGGPLASWLIDQLPDLEPAAPRRQAAADAATVVPLLPVPAELEPLLAGAAVDPAAFARAVAQGLAAGDYTLSHRAVLQNAVARVDPGALAATIAALETGLPHLERGDWPDAAPRSLWESLHELASMRREMLDELERTETRTQL